MMKLRTPPKNKKAGSAAASTRLARFRGAALPCSFADIEAAAKRIAGAVLESPCPFSIPLSDLTRMKIFCKLDHLQRTGSFKERGARNALLLLTPDQRKRGVIAAS